MDRRGSRGQEAPGTLHRTRRRPSATPPVGNYFDPTEPSLEKTVASLNGIEVAYNPGERTKYSNVGIGLVGYTLEVSQGEKFEKVVQQRVLDLLGIKSSSFVPNEATKKDLADAVMWSYHGREFPAAASWNVS